MNFRTIPALVILLATLPLMAADWPQYGGPNRNGIAKESGLLKAWPKSGPKLAWTFNQTGVGYSSPSIAGDRLYVLGGRGKTEVLIAINAKTGKELWTAKIGPLFSWNGNSWNQGPSSSPSVDGNLIFALGGQGNLICVDGSGKEQWRKDLPKELGAQVNPIGGGPKNVGWGFTWSPLVDGDMLICQPGGPQGTLAALNKKTGKVMWRSKGYTDQASYASPLAAEIDGTRQYVNITNQGLTGVAAKDGSVLWRYQRNPAYNDCVIPTPLIQGNLVYATVGFGLGCDLVQVKGKKAQGVYQNRNMENLLGGVVLIDGHVYGYTDSKKSWICQDLKSGKVVWAERGALGRGAVISAEGLLYCYGDAKGTCVLAEANPKGWAEKGRFTIPQTSKLNKPSGRIWTHPVIANGRLYLRDQDLLFSFDIKGK